MESSTNLRPGSLLRNTYRIIRVLGQGGFGITYLAEHIRLNKQMAIKEFFPQTLCSRDAHTSQVITATEANSELVEKLRSKFLKEAEHIAKMNSPYIIQINDVFEENNTAYYIMEYIDGMSLADMVKRFGPMPVNQALDYITKIGQALTYIHAKRVNHLDVKPANIMVRREDNNPILVDFGLAKQYDSEGNQTSTTPVGISQGYAPMEQYNIGGVSEFSPQSDLYSLAATLYYLLTGVVPPQAPSLIDNELAFPPNFPQWLIPVIRQAMSTKRAHRQDSVQTFCRQLQSNGSDESTHLYTQQPHNTAVNAPVNDRRLNGVNESYNHRNTLEEKIAAMTDDERTSFRNKNIALTIALSIAVVLLFILLFNLKGCGSQNRTYEDLDSAVHHDTETGIVETPTDENRVANDASAYFLKYADMYRSSNGDIYYEGSLSNERNNIPISLCFMTSNNGLPTNCIYHNIKYDSTLEMSVSFSGNTMTVSGDGVGISFTMDLTPGVNGQWEGDVQNGDFQFKAEIHPM